MDPRRQSNDLGLAKMAREQGIPTLGICLGMQVMNVAAGGTLVQDIDSALQTEIRHASMPEDRGRHDVIIEKGTRLGQILREHELNVNSSHHQAIGKVGEGLRVTAHAPDGIIEGLEDPKHPFYVDRKSTRLNSSHLVISYAVFCLKKKTGSGTSYIPSKVNCFLTDITSVSGVPSPS